jgi:Fe/S biogenesis protein NfuA
LPFASTLITMSETLVGNSVLTVTSGALETILEARNGEVDSTSLALWLEVNATPAKFSYDMYFQPIAEAGENDVHVEQGGLTVIIPADSVDKLRGATLDLATDGSGMVLSNPNEPKKPEVAGAIAPTGTLDSPLATRIVTVIEQQVNPSIASHGGFATLVSVDNDTAFITMGGGCQGCAGSKATLKQGIEKAIKASVPEIAHVIDVTDHQNGANPYYA